MSLDNELENLTEIVRVEGIQPKIDIIERDMEKFLEGDTMDQLRVFSTIASKDETAELSFSLLQARVAMERLMSFVDED